METIRGKMSHHLDLNGLNERLANFTRVILDLGTGDGRYVHYLAGKNPSWFIIGVDACRENLREHSRAKLSNALFVIAGAQNLPRELHGRVSRITINFPWGSLLESLLEGDANLLHGLESVSGPDASLHLHLNGGALAEIGASLETGTQTISHHLLSAGWQLDAPVQLGAPSLRGFPTTWARRLAHGRDPRAMALRARRTE
jgi:16S rRNA (adenine(1408)-N(1))-methyltransferase